MYDLCTFEEMEDVFRHCPESHYQKQKRISEKDKLLVLYIHYLLPVRISEIQILKNISQPGYLSCLLSVKLTTCRLVSSSVYSVLPSSVMCLPLHFFFNFTTRRTQNIDTLHISPLPHTPSQPS